MQTRAILERLDRQLSLLVGGAEDPSPRHQTLRAAIARSYDPLDGGERLLFNRLATFVGGCATEAAQAVCAGDGLTADVVPGILESLLRRSLLNIEHRPDGASRYRFLDSIREYAFERLTASGEADRTRRASGGGGDLGRLDLSTQVFALLDHAIPRSRTAARIPFLQMASRQS